MMTNKKIIVTINPRNPHSGPGSNWKIRTQSMPIILYIFCRYATDDPVQPEQSLSKNNFVKELRVRSLFDTYS